MADPGGLLHFVEVEVGTGGLPSCRHCGPATTLSPRPVAEIVDAVHAEVAGWNAAELGPGPNLTFGGGEPFSHPDLPAAVFAAVEAGVARIRLRTGGEALSVAENAEGVVHAGVRQIEILVLGDGTAHDDLAGRPGAFAALAEGSKRFRGAGSTTGVDVSVTGRVTVCRHNLERVAATVAALAELGAGEVVLDVTPEAAASVDAGQWISSACDTGVVNGTWVAVVADRAIPLVPAIHLTAASATVSSAASGTNRAQAGQS